MRKNCDSCKHDEFGEKYCDDCVSSKGNAPSKWEPADYYEPDTNADRIRSMSDEELADFLTEEKWKCDNYRVCRECPRYIGDCCLPLDEWLQQPAEEK